ncbi:MAG: hypothetical protein CM15mP17_09120 [Gammaproteobacteria bacterium]|nr:MAG: hypothetical protein CM15mP17_09120 [Gammaproteobacteria bacterium]
MSSKYGIKSMAISDSVEAVVRRFSIMVSAFCRLLIFIPSYLNMDSIE